jgi:cobalt-zinc-cadmium efflux system membrane fusion protein
MKMKVLLISLTISFSLLFIGCNSKKDHADEHEVHEHNGAESHADEKEGDHDHGAQCTHEAESNDAHDSEHHDESEIELSSEAIKLAEITLAEAIIGKISGIIDLSGEVGFNEDQLVHITPRFPGIAKEVKCTIGDYVKANDILAFIESNESMTSYPLKASISGRIIQKHITLGEHVSETESVFLIANLSTVWVNLAVYTKDALIVKTGQKVVISQVGTNISKNGVIQYMTPVVDQQTRKITARVVLPNNNNEWRPGTFVKAHIETDGGKDGVLVDKEAVQILNNETVVFISDEPNRYRPVDVVTGESDAVYIQIIKGLEPGAEYVSKGAFELKAKIVTSSLGEHAGHNH